MSARVGVAFDVAAAADEDFWKSQKEARSAVFRPPAAVVALSVALVELAFLPLLPPPQAPNHGEVKRFLALGDRAVADYERAQRDETFGAKIFTQNGGKNTEGFSKQAAAYGLTKCKSDDQNGGPKLDPATFSPEKRAYVSQADAVCKRNIDQQKPLEDKYLATFPPPLHAWSGFIPQALPLERAKLADLRRLNPPAADKATIEGIWNKNQALNDKIEAAGRAAAAKDEN